MTHSRPTVGPHPQLAMPGAHTPKGSPIYIAPVTYGFLEQPQQHRERPQAPQVLGRGVLAHLPCSLSEKQEPLPVSLAGFWFPGGGLFSHEHGVFKLFILRSVLT